MSEHAKVTKAVGALSVVTFISRIFGFLRVMVIAKIFGAGMVADAFFVAFRISNILRELLAEGSIPKYTFESFVVGSSNQFAHAAARAVAFGVGYLVGLRIAAVPAEAMAITPRAMPRRWNLDPIHTPHASSQHTSASSQMAAIATMNVIPSPFPPRRVFPVPRASVRVAPSVFIIDDRRGGAMAGSAKVGGDGRGRRAISGAGRAGPGNAGATIRGAGRGRCCG